MTKTVLITGASQGLGAVMAKMFAENGYHVAINYFSDAQLADAQGVAAYCRDKGVEAECYVGDVSKPEDCRKLADAVLERFGAVDVLINNAGITRDGLLLRMSDEQFNQVIDVNLKSVFNMIKAVIPSMMKKRSGRIINLASVSGLYGNASQVNYSASKAGVMGITMSVAKEFGSRNITCNALAPGFIDTHMTDVLPDKVKEEVLNRISLKRFGRPEDVAHAALFLAGEGASYITGQAIVIDGGLAM